VRRESSAAVYSWRAPDAPPSRMPATYEISVIELPLFSCHGCSDASLLPALGRTFYLPRRVHHSSGSTIAAGEVCRTSHNLRRPRRRLVPMGATVPLCLLARYRDFLTISAADSRAIACQPRRARRMRRDAGTPGAAGAAPAAAPAGRGPSRLNAGPGPTPRGAGRRPPRPRRRPGPAPW
jgi:hypothetical protein